MNWISPLFAILCYLAAAIWLYGGITQKIKSCLRLTAWISGSAILLQGYQLHIQIDTLQGQDINALNLLSFVTWLMAIISFMPRSALVRVRVLVFVLNACVMSIQLFFPASPVLHIMAGHPEQWIHVGLAALTVGFIFVAALQAFLLLIQDRGLHHSHLFAFFHRAPSIESTERSLFRLILIAFGLLTIMIGTGFYLFEPTLRGAMLRKTLLVMITWVVLLLLLMGRYLFGWRGRKATIYTVMSFLLLTIIYFI